MDRREADLLADNQDSDLYRSFKATTSSSSCSFSSSSSPPDFLRNVQAAFKRHRMIPQLNNIQPRRLVVPRQETLKISDGIVEAKTVAQFHDVSTSERLQDSISKRKNMMMLTAVNHEDASITPPSPKYSNKTLADQTVIQSQVYSADVCSHIGERHEISRNQQGEEAGHTGTKKDSPPLDDKSIKGNSFAGDITDVQSQAPILGDQSSYMKAIPSKSDIKEKSAASKHVSAPRKKNHDPTYFKVNGTTYQWLAKIGSGGSSEVHKVISHDRTIHALKKIKLKGRDFATAYGFCQEIEYLNKLRGKDHIIQLIDYEVTDKDLLKEVMSGSLSNKDGRVREDGHIHMVLEYGEIDLAHMLSQKWKELDNSKLTIDENWLRFYWQQMLLAVETIHEERIVHSDLKPANFLLVNGSLKLIDFGIAKAIMNDTTNIQRDSQVGTLSYMSPEAFMCNETDANGKTIKCGRSSDIWSLGCILYQMVYGRTPFANYKTFWAKFKVITDPNHEIPYKSLPNPWLLDLMKKCLAWDRTKRWTIPQLLQHPFLVPQIPPQLSTPNGQNFKLIQLLANSCTNDSKASIQCTQLQQLLMDPFPDEESISLDKICMLLYEMSKVCLQLKEHLANSE